MEIISADAFISINATFFVQLASFLLFIVVLNKIMVRPLKKIMSKRNEYIVKIQNKIDSSLNELNVILSNTEMEKNETINKSFIITSKMENDAKNEAKKIYKNAKSKVNFIQKKYDVERRHQITALKSDLYKDIDNITILVMEKIVDRRLTK